MKRSFLFAAGIIIALAFFTGCAREPAVDITNDFECPNFLEVVRSIVSTPSENHTSERIYAADVRNITSITARVKNITSLAGIQHFTALEFLDVTSNQITQADFSNNPALKVLIAEINYLTQINLSHNPALETLSLVVNRLTELDVSNNRALNHLSVSFNPLTELDVSRNLALEGLFVLDGQLTELDISNNRALKRVWLDYNKLTELDVSGNPALIWLSVKNNDMQNVYDVIGWQEIGLQIYEDFLFVKEE